MEARMIKAGRREYGQVLRLLETFGMADLHVAIKNALRMGQLALMPSNTSCCVSSRSADIG